MTPDTQTLHSPAWLRFVYFDGVGLFLSDASVFNRSHKAHRIAQGFSELLAVLVFDARNATITDCPDCAEKLCRIVFDGDMAVLYSGDVLAEAEHVFDEHEARLRTGAGS